MVRTCNTIALQPVLELSVSTVFLYFLAVLTLIYQQVGNGSTVKTRDTTWKTTQILLLTVTTISTGFGFQPATETGSFDPKKLNQSCTLTELPEILAGQSIHGRYSKQSTIPLAQRKRLEAFIMLTCRSEETCII